MYTAKYFSNVSTTSKVCIHNGDVGKPHQCILAKYKCKTCEKSIDHWEHIYVCQNCASDPNGQQIEQDATTCHPLSYHVHKDNEIATNQADFQKHKRSQQNNINNNNKCKDKARTHGKNEDGNKKTKKMKSNKNNKSIVNNNKKVNSLNYNRRSDDKDNDNGNGRDYDDDDDDDNGNRKIDQSRDKATNYRQSGGGSKNSTKKNINKKTNNYGNSNGSGNDKEGCTEEEHVHGTVVLMKTSHSSGGGSKEREMIVTVVPVKAGGIKMAKRETVVA